MDAKAISFDPSTGNEFGDLLYIRIQNLVLRFPLAIQFNGKHVATYIDAMGSFLLYQPNEVDSNLIFFNSRQLIIN